MGIGEGSRGEGTVQRHRGGEVVTERIATEGGALEHSASVEGCWEAARHMTSTYSM